MSQPSYSLALGTIQATFTPLNASSLSPIQFTADDAWDENEFLSEPQPTKEMGKRFMTRGGQRSVVLFNNSSAGTVDLTLIDGPVVDQLKAWAQQINPRVRFNLDVSFQRNDADASNLRVYHFANAFMKYIPVAAVSDDGTVTMKTSIDYESFESINPATGQAV